MVVLLTRSNLVLAVAKVKQFDRTFVLYQIIVFLANQELLIKIITWIDELITICPQTWKRWTLHKPWGQTHRSTEEGKLLHLQHVGPRRWVEIIQLLQGCPILPQNGTDWHQKGQIWDFWRYFSVHFGSPSQNVLKNDLQKSQICPIWCQFDSLLSLI